MRIERCFGFSDLALWVLIPLTVLTFGRAQASSAELNQVSIRMSEADFDRVVIGRGQKSEARAQITVNGGTPQSGFVESRGQSCLIAAKRPCLNLKLETSQAFLGKSGLKGKNFNLVSMWQDRGYFSSRFGFEIFRELEIFEIRNEYTLVMINDRPMGLYLATDKPKKVIARISTDPWIVRRGYRTKIEVVEPSTAISKAEGVKRFQDLYRILEHHSGERLLAELQSRLNLSRYMKWLLVNSLLRNGDYSDEVFFYLDSSDPSRKFDIMPWDFDDLFKAPHESDENLRFKDEIASGLLYGFENPLDQKIYFDPALNRLLHEEAKKLFTSITPELVTKIVDSIASDLIRYGGAEPAVLQNGLQDSYRKAYSTDFFRKNAEMRKIETLKRLEFLKSKTR
jgi:spore coat protein H